MEEKYRKAYAEVLEILNHTEKEIVEKIPNSFIDFLQKNKDESYVVNIDFNDDNWDNSVQEETLAIIALIYRDYIVSKEEKSKLIENERKELKAIEDELREKYNPDNLFKKDKVKEEYKENTEVVALVEQKKEGFFSRIISKIIKFFKR